MFGVCRACLVVMCVAPSRRRPRCAARMPSGVLFQYGAFAVHGAFARRSGSRRRCCDCAPRHPWRSPGCQSAPIALLRPRVRRSWTQRCIHAAAAEAPARAVRACVGVAWLWPWIDIKCCSYRRARVLADRFLAELLPRRGRTPAPSLETGQMWAATVFFEVAPRIGPSRSAFSCCRSITSRRIHPTS